MIVFSGYFPGLPEAMAAARKVEKKYRFHDVRILDHSGNGTRLFSFSVSEADVIRYASGIGLIRHLVTYCAEPDSVPPAPVADPQWPYKAVCLLYRSDSEGSFYEEKPSPEWEERSEKYRGNLMMRAAIQKALASAYPGLLEEIRRDFSESVILPHDPTRFTP